MRKNVVSIRQATIGLLTATAIGLLGLTPLQAGELRIGNAGEPDTLDPHHASGTWENRIIGDMFMGLATEAADGSVIPGAAESWTVSDDGLVYTFALREHTWSDGTDVTADDFVFAMRRLLAPETAAEYASIMYSVSNAKALNEASMDGMENLGVKAIDDKTLEVTLEYPAPYFIEQLTHFTAFPVPKHKVEELGEDWVKPENIVSNATKQFRAGEIDIQYDFASEQIDWLKENMPDETRISPYLGIYYYPINTSKPPFDNVDVRQALAMAIDREAITDKVLKTGEIPAYSFVPPDAGEYGEPAYVDWKDFSYEDRVAKATELLAAAGFDPENPLSLQLRYNTSENHKKVAIAVAAMWKKIGVQAELFNAEVKVHYNDLRAGTTTPRIFCT